MKKCLMSAVIVSAMALIAFTAFAEEEEKTKKPAKPPAERTARTRPTREGARARPGQPGQRPQMNREQMIKQRMDASEKAVTTAKKEKKTVIGELKAIQVLAEKEKAKKTAARIEKLITKLSPKYDKNIKDAESRLKRFKEAIERGMGARTRTRGERPEGGQRGQRGQRGGGFGGAPRGGGFGGGAPRGGRAPAEQPAKDDTKKTSEEK